MGKYDVNFSKLIRDSLIVALRGNLVEFTYVLIKPIRDIYFRFLEAKQGSENKLSYNAQYPNLQRLLNDKIDAISRRIKVRDSGESIDELLIFPNEELKPIHLGQVPIFPSSRWGYKPFTVLVPKELENFENRIKRLLDNYKFSGTNYEIEYYE
jgi:hypothetical protein